MYQFFFKRFFLIQCIVCSVNFLFASRTDVNAVLNSLSLEQKIGQLFMVPATVDPFTNSSLIKKKTYRLDKEYVKLLIEKYHIGGIILLGQGTSELQAQLTEEFYTYSKLFSSIPLWFGQDLEPSFFERFGFNKAPHASELGKNDNVSATFEIGQMVGKIAIGYGVQLILAPVVDIHYSDQSLITKNRSFGQSGELVVRHSSAFIDGIYSISKYLIPCIKHFPNHGATALDSHNELPTVNQVTEDMVYPFQEILKKYSCAVMVGHIACKNYDDQLPAIFNGKIIDIIKSYNKKSLIVTDALDMKAVETFENKEVHALKAGCHLLLCSPDVPRAISEIKQALNDGTLSMNTIDHAVMKILKRKY